MAGRMLLLATVAALIACASASPEMAQYMQRPCTPDWVASGGFLCDWRALNVSRAPGSFAGHYRSLDRDFAGGLVVVERGDGFVMSMEGGSRATQHQCYGLFEGVVSGARAELTASPDPIFAEPCHGALERVDDDVVRFSMDTSCYAMCGARVIADGDYRLSRD